MSAEAPAATKPRSGLFCCLCCNPQPLEDDDLPASRYQRFTDLTEASLPEQSSTSSQEQLGPSDFEVLSVLGRGTYGKVPAALALLGGARPRRASGSSLATAVSQVLLVKKRTGGTLYAMKVLHKADILKRNQLRHTLTERSVLQSVRHPFIVHMHFSFQSAHQLFLVMSYLAGGELFFHLRREGQLPEPRAQLYAAEILLALQAPAAAD